MNSSTYVMELRWPSIMLGTLLMILNSTTITLAVSAEEGQWYDHGYYEGYQFRGTLIGLKSKWSSGIQGVWWTYEFRNDYSNYVRVAYCIPKRGLQGTDCFPREVSLPPYSRQQLGPEQMYRDESFVANVSKVEICSSYYLNCKAQ